MTKRDLERRLGRLEAAPPADVVYLWLREGETKEDVIARAGVPAGASVVLYRWAREGERVPGLL